MTEVELIRLCRGFQMPAVDDLCDRLEAAEAALAAERARLDTLLRWAMQDELSIGVGADSVFIYDRTGTEPHDGTEAGKRAALRTLLDRAREGT